MTCPNNESGKHCYEEDPEAHTDRFGRAICCFCRKPKLATTPVKAVHEAATARQTAQVHCAICHQKAPRVLVNDHPMRANTLTDKNKVWQNDLNGWMVAEFPFRDDYLAAWQSKYTEGTLPSTKWQEKAKLCPPCATKVRAYMAHLAKPMLSSEDL